MTATGPDAAGDAAADQPHAGRRSPAGRALRDVRGADRRRAPARRRPGEPRADVHLPAAATCCSPPSAPTLRYRAVPDRYLSFPARPGPGRLGRAADPGRAGLLLPQLGAGRVVAFYPGPAGATESELPLDAWDAVLAANPALGLLRPDVEALLLRGAERGPRGSTATCADRRLLRAGRPAAVAVARLRRRAAGARRPSTPSSTTSAPQPARTVPSRRTGAHRDRLEFSVVDVFAEPYAAAPQLTARLRITESTGQPCTRSRCAARSASSRSAGPTSRPTRRGCAPCSATATGGPTRCGRSCGCSAARWCRASPASPRSTSRCRAPTTSRSPGPATCTPSATAWCR